MSCGTGHKTSKLNVDASQTRSLLNSSPPLQVAKMLEGLQRFNAAASASGNQDQGCPPEVLLETWASDMLWSAPGGALDPAFGVMTMRATRKSLFRSAVFKRTQDF